MQLRLNRLRSPIGEILLVTGHCGAVRALDFADYEARMHRLLQRHYGDYQLKDGAAPQDVTAILDSYFDGDLTALKTVATATGGTDFQRRVWAALRAIPAGSTLTYGALAKALGNPAASRAVGLANGANPIGIIVPCHRVIGANGKLTGYGGGLDRKRWLLDHEQKLSVDSTSKQARLHL